MSGSAALLQGANVAAAPAPKRKLPVISVQALLDVQQTLTAVERFADLHESGEVGEPHQIYRDLLPIARPKNGQQYAFEVDLDACTGCKACVTGCHSMNGLDEGETWRGVGLLHGGTSEQPAARLVTSSCHHCVEPACMAGCPVNAYEKDAVTGIVKHLDDQCIGCQYCTLMCPYDAPKFNKRLGIVRKCDMCSDRLEHSEAPACVQACPNGAISIRIVDQLSMIQASEAHSFLPSTPSPENTIPTTRYKTNKALPPNMLSADFYSVKAEHSHPALVIMLTLTQLSVGAFVLGLGLETLTGRALGSPLAQAAFACFLAVLALGASVFHLGRPWLFFRAVLGLRTSWLSREALCFGFFAKLAILYGVLLALPSALQLPYGAVVAEVAHMARIGAAVFGTLGVFSSVMVYVATKRVQWQFEETGIRFFGTSLILGAAAVLTVSAAPSETPLAAQDFRALLGLIAGVTLVKLVFEARVFGHLRGARQSVLKRQALLLTGQLRSATMLRFGVALFAGGALPAALLAIGDHGSHLGVTGPILLLLLLAGELAERYLFFSAAPASQMPGPLP